MVTQFGFSEVVGDVDLGSRYNQLSAQTKETIETEVRRIIDEGRVRTTKLLTERRKELDLIAKALVEYEVLNLEEMQQVLRGEKLPKLTTTPGTPIKLPELSVPPGMNGSQQRGEEEKSQVPHGNGGESQG
jgi:ATP-dependent metalloprotease